MFNNQNALFCNTDGISSSSEPLDSKALAAVLAKVGTGEEEQWGVRQRTFLQNVLFSITDNKTLGMRYQGVSIHLFVLRIYFVSRNLICMV